MITELTDENIKMFDVYVKKHVDIGLSSVNVSEEETKIIIDDFYKVILNQPPPEKIVIKDSPYSVWQYICDQVGVKMKFVSPYLVGSFDVNIFCFYDYMFEELGVKIDDDIKKKYDVWRETIKLGPIYPFDDVCIVSKKAASIMKNDNGLHCENGPAVRYDDGIEIYALNGVVMDKKWIMTPPEKIDVLEAMKINNAEIRRELVRKIGIERVCEKMNADVIDVVPFSEEKHANYDESVKVMIRDQQKKTGKPVNVYELLMLDIGTGEKRPFLRMINPSIGTLHVEGVSPECRTIKDAMIFRNGTDIEPSQLT